MASQAAQPEPRPTEEEPARRRRFGWRRIASPILIVLATIVLFIAALAIWIDFSVLDTDEFTETSSQILADEQVQAALAPFLVNEIFSSVDIQASLEDVLPSGLDRVAGPVAAGLEEVALRATTRLLASEQFQTLWSEAVRLSHQQFITIVEGNSAAIATIDGKVVLNLRPMVERIFTRVGLDPEVLTRLPLGAGQIVVVEESKLSALQKLVDILQKMAKWLWVIALLLYVAAVWLARGRRRAALRGVGLSLLFVGLGHLVLLRLGGPRLVESLVAVPANEPAVLNIWNILTDNLRDSARTLLLVGTFIFLGAWLAGAGRRAVAIRGWLAPRIAERPALVHGVIVLALFLYLLFAPTRENRSLFGTLVLLAILFGGAEVLRRMMLRELSAAPAPAARAGDAGVGAG